jgi:hypothetical protein
MPASWLVVLHVSRALAMDSQILDVYVRHRMKGHQPALRGLDDGLRSPCDDEPGSCG